MGIYVYQPVVALRAMPGTTLRPSGISWCATRSPKGEAWWSQAGSNRRPLACHASALPAELWPLKSSSWDDPGGSVPAGESQSRLARCTLFHRSGLISSLFITTDITNDVGDVLIALFLVGNEGRIIVIVVVDGLVDLDIVFRFGNCGLDLAAVLLGIGLLERDRLFGLGRLRRGVCGCSVAGFGAAGRAGRRHRRNRHHFAGIGR